MDEFYQALERLPVFLQRPLMAAPAEMARTIQEIRLRSGRPVVLVHPGGFWYLGKDGAFSTQPDPFAPLGHEALQECFYSLCGHSVHSYEQELSQGFFTLPGGHRVGVAGVPVWRGQELSAFKTVTSLDIRIARAVRCVLPPVLKQLLSQPFRGILLVGAPGSGKTTLLRTVAQQLSGVGKNICVIDERCEVFPCSLQGFGSGVPLHCDVLSGYPKAFGILQAVRTLAPQVVLCDELGGAADVRAVEQGLHAGVGFVASIHESDAATLARRPQFQELQALAAFDAAVFLAGAGQPGKISEVIPL